MGNPIDKGKKIRNRKSYKDMRDTILWLEQNPPITDILARIFDSKVQGYGTRVMDARESLDFITKEYKDAKRQTQGTAG